MHPFCQVFSDMPQAVLGKFSFYVNQFKVQFTHFKMNQFSSQFIIQNFELSSRFQKMYQFIVLFFFFHILLNYTIAYCRTTDSNYFISCNTETVRQISSSYPVLNPYPTRVYISIEGTAFPHCCFNALLLSIHFTLVAAAAFTPTVYSQKHQEKCAA